jgi:hypothetical protein
MLLDMLPDEPKDNIPERPELPDRNPDPATTNEPLFARPSLPDRDRSLTARCEPEALRPPPILPREEDQKEEK